MFATHKAPQRLSEHISDEQWAARINKPTTPFHEASLSLRLDFIEKFAHMHDWSSVSFGAILEPAELETIVLMMKNAVLRCAMRARTLLDQGDTEAASTICLDLMRASKLCRFSDPIETCFGNAAPHRAPNLLGDYISCYWNRSYAAMEHSRLTALAHKLLDLGLAPALVARTVMDA